MVRWDSPLFTVPWTDDDVPGEYIWNAVTKGDVKAPNVGTQAVRMLPRLGSYIPITLLPHRLPRPPRMPFTHWSTQQR
jgi:hypothetical protein